MLQAILSVPTILIAILVMTTGTGYLSTLITLRLQDAGVDALSISIVTAAYFAGLTIGALRIPQLINRVGQIRGFAAFVSLYSVTSLSYALTDATWAWLILRLVDGICGAAVCICLESWLNSRKAVQGRGMVLAAYMIALYLGQAIGQQLLTIAPGTAALPFLIASIPISLAVIPIALTRLSSPEVSEHLPIPVRQLYTLSPLGFVGVTVSGVLLGAFYGLGAVYARRIGLSVAETASFMSVVIIGGVALQWPLGRLSDRFDRRRVIVWTQAGCLAITALLALLTPGPSLYVAAALFGGVSFALYPLAVAHTNDHLAPGQGVAASGGLVLIYSVGAAAGPIIGGSAMRGFGTSGLFLTMSACSGAALVFALWRQIARAPVPRTRQQPYRILPRTTPVATTIVQSGGDGNRADHPGIG